MFVSGSLTNDYLFIPAYSELKAFVRVFGGLLVNTKDGWTYKNYASVPSQIIEGAEYFGAIADKTRSFDTKTELLTYLKRGINSATGEILDASKGFVLNDKATQTADGLGFMTNHVPQLFAELPHATNKTTVITGFNGNYDFTTKRFRGFIEYDLTGNIWNA